MCFDFRAELCPLWGIDNTYPSLLLHAYLFFLLKTLDHFPAERWGGMTSSFYQRAAVFSHYTSVVTQPFTTIAWRHLYRVKSLNRFFHGTEKKENCHISKTSLVLLKTLVYTDSNYCLSKIIPGKN